jgi:predicted Zn-dependent peptidase
MTKPPYQLTELPGGLRVATATMPHMASAAIGIWVGVGGRFEPARLSGIAHFIEHMLFKGTARRTAREISEAVEGIGGYLNAFTSEDNTCFYARAHASRSEELLDVLVDMFRNSRFDPVEIDKEREVIKEEYTMYRDQPAQLVQELFNEAAWPGQALGRPLTGTPATIDAIQRADFLRHMRTHYVRGCTVIAAAGSIEHADLVKQVSKRLKAFRAGPRPKFEPAVPSTHSPVVHIHTRETEQTQIALGFRTCSRHDERRFALRLLNAMLGESMSSRLFQSIREDHGLVYSVYSATSFWEDVGDIVISAGLDGDKLQRTIDLVAKEIQLLREKPPGKAEFRRARDYAIGQMELSLEGTENRMMALGEHILGYGSVANPEGSKNRLSQVTPAEVRGVARDFLRMDRLTCALVTPRKRPGRVRDWVRAIG